MSTEPMTEAGKEHLFHEAPAPRRIVKALVPIIGGRDVLIGMRHERFLEAVTAIEAEAREQGARAERERLTNVGWREPHRHSFNSVGDPHPSTQCAGDNCWTRYGDLHPAPPLADPEP